MRRLMLPLDEETRLSLKCGEEVLLSGYIYTARDAAHKRMMNGIPFDIKDAAIYYVGPSQSKPNEIYGSCGPTTASRMDAYTPHLLDKGLRCIIAKGKRNSEVKKALIRNKGIYFVTIGGLGAYLKKCVKEVEAIAYEDLGTESIKRLYIEDFPVFVGIDTKGEDIYE